MIRRVRKEILNGPTSTLQKVFLLFALLMPTVVSSKLMWPKVGWTILAILIAIDIEFGIYAAFFMSAFFTTAGFFPNLFFTLKHFHIVILLLMFVQLLKGQLFLDFKLSLQKFSVYFLLLGVIALSTVLSLNHPGVIQATRTNGSFLILIISAAFLVSVIKRKETLKTAMSFYLAGVATRILLSSISQFNFPFLNISERLLFNNHIGFLASSSFFIGVSLILSEKHKVKQLVYVAFTTIVFGGLLTSCSRTGWLSCVITFIFFVLLYFKTCPNNLLKEALLNSRFSLIATAILILIAFLPLNLMEVDIFNRFVALKKLLKPDYWFFTFHDQQNFGFLGIFRLNQFSTIGELLKDNWLFGVGLIRTTTDFHSLYLTMLGGTGICGLGLFLAFSFFWIWNLLTKQPKELILLRPGILCAFFIWLLYSFLESFFLQFHIWTLSVMGIALAFLDEK